VLVASGTGFAPMWSVAVAAIMEQPQREMVFIVQARSIRSLYMHAALCRLALFPNVRLIPMVSEPQQISHAIQSGRPTDHLPKLSPDDVVYTAGAPAMTDAVARIAKAAGARCYTDPFVQEPRTAEQQSGLMSRLTGWLNEPKSGTIPPQPARKAAPMPRGVAAAGAGNR
jgi:3-phenylpropionate/trans-cinnamate dioxygenase ferredoxin reductase subunit